MALAVFVLATVGAFTVSLFLRDPGNGSRWEMAKRRLFEPQLTTSSSSTRRSSATPIG